MGASSAFYEQRLSVAFFFILFFFQPAELKSHFFRLSLLQEGFSAKKMSCFYGVSADSIGFSPFPFSMIPSAFIPFSHLLGRTKRGSGFFPIAFFARLFTLHIVLGFLPS